MKPPPRVEEESGPPSALPHTASRSNTPPATRPPHRKHSMCTVPRRAPSHRAHTLHFRCVDSQKSLHISQEDLRYYTEQEFKKYDTNKDGAITYDEFVLWYNSLNGFVRQPSGQKHPGASSPPAFLQLPTSARHLVAVTFCRPGSGYLARTDTITPFMPRARRTWRRTRPRSGWAK